MKDLFKFSRHFGDHGNSSFLTDQIVPALFKNIDDGILFSDMQGNIIFANDAALEINDFEPFPSDLDERASLFLFSNKRGRTQFEDLPIQRTLKQGEISNLDVIFLSSKGLRKNLLCSTTILKDEFGKSLGVVLIKHDQTAIEEKKRENTKLESENSELLRINQQLEHFAAVAAHDLKSPLNTITQFTEHLKDKFEGLITQEDGMLFERIDSAGKRLRNLIDDLLAYSKAGEYVGEIKTIDLKNVVNEALSLLESDLKNGDAVVEIGYLPVVRGDYDGLLRVFQNLIANPPIIRVFCEPADETWKISIADNGRGIQSEHLQSVFELFNRQEAKADEDGTGLGLPICKRIIEAHNGELIINSKIGVGTILTIILPKNLN